jgi:hypothetical protein
LGEHLIHKNPAPDVVELGEDGPRSSRVPLTANGRARQGGESTAGLLPRSSGEIHSCVSHYCIVMARTVYSYARVNDRVEDKAKARKAIIVLYVLAAVGIVLPFVFLAFKR